LYVNNRERLYVAVTYPTQFSPPVAENPGKGGKPKGYAELGRAQVVTKPVWEYESPKLNQKLGLTALLTKVESFVGPPATAAVELLTNNPRTSEMAAERRSILKEL